MTFDVHNSNTLRLLAHIVSLAWILATVEVVFLARGRVNCRHWRLLCVSGLTYAVWFFMLAISIRDAELIRRGEVAWLFGAVELAGGIGGAGWIILTIRASFRLNGRRGQNVGKPLAGGNKDNDLWLQAQLLSLPALRR